MPLFPVSHATRLAAVECWEVGIVVTVFLPAVRILAVHYRLALVDVSLTVGTLNPLKHGRLLRLVQLLKAL
jgi:hypothetical protein